MKILVACECSRIVAEAFEKRGHYVLSCDLAPAEKEGNHYQGDIKDVLYDNWDMVIAHPVCQFLTVTGAKWFYHPDDKHLPISKRRVHPKFPNRRQQQKEAIEFFMLFTNLKTKKVVIENPVGIMSTVWRKPDQIIQPFWFGHPEPKKTCLWIKGLPLLQPTKIVEPEYHITKSGKRVPAWFFLPSPSAQRQIDRSRTFPGIADAMGEQWGQNKE